MIPWTPDFRSWLITTGCIPASRDDSQAPCPSFIIALHPAIPPVGETIPVAVECDL